MSTVKRISGSYTIQSDSTTIQGNLAVTNNTLTANLSVNGYSVGYLQVPQISFTDDSTVSSSAAGKHYYSTLSTNKTLTIANNSTVSYAVGTEFTVVNLGTGNITLANASGVNLYRAGNTTPGNRIITNTGFAKVLNLAANVWIVDGSGVV